MNHLDQCCEVDERFTKKIQHKNNNCSHEYTKKSKGRGQDVC